jgi:hypothetical protein
VQLDNTRIAIRERGVLDTLDLSLHVMRVYAWPLLQTMAMGVIPLMIVNYALIGWMMGDIDNELDYPFRFVWHVTVLAFIQAPLASVFASAYLGQAVFLHRPRVRDVIYDVGKMFPRVIACQVLIRGVAANWLLLLAVDRHGDFDVFLEVFLLLLLVGYSAAIRAFRPFVNEIVLLERNPLTSRDRNVLTAGRRSSMLHSIASGDLFFRWIAASIVGVLLVLAIYSVFLFLSGVFLNDWSQGPLMVRYCLPLAMWLVAAYMTVFRFLSYLDLRIRQEGWEVELRLRAEASRLLNSPA